MVMDYLFRDYRNADYGEFEQMVFGLYEDDPEDEPIISENIASTVRELARHPEKGKIVIFTSNGEIVGYAILIFYWSNEFGGNSVYIDELYVKREWRSRGIASRLFEYLSTFDPENTKALYLEVNPTNPRARDLYTRQGFAPPRTTLMLKRLR
jgi:ribosomal protein S18 acetylase RimI-like enzyme